MTAEGESSNRSNKEEEGRWRGGKKYCRKETENGKNPFSKFSVVNSVSDPFRPGPIILRRRV